MAGACGSKSQSAARLTPVVREHFSTGPLGAEGPTQKVLNVLLCDIIVLCAAPRRRSCAGPYGGSSNLGPSSRLPAESTHTIWSTVGSPVGIICSSSDSNRRESVLVIFRVHPCAATVVGGRSAQSRAL